MIEYNPKILSLFYNNLIHTFFRFFQDHQLDLNFI